MACGERRGRGNKGKSFGACSAPLLGTQKDVEPFLGYDLLLYIVRRRVGIFTCRMWAHARPEWVEVRDGRDEESSMEMAIKDLIILCIEQDEFTTRLLSSYIRKDNLN